MRDSLKHPGHVAVLGGGAWGTALANLTARNGNPTKLWVRDKNVAESINHTHANTRYLPDILLCEPLVASMDLSYTLTGADMVLLVVPVQTTGPLAEKLAQYIMPNIPIVCCAKGIERASGKFPAQIIASHFPDNPVAVLSGPSFAHDVARDLPTAVSLAAAQINQARSIATILSNQRFRIYLSDDIMGLQIGGALKNVMALAVGAVRGMGLGASAEAALIARGFAELQRIGIAMGAHAETFSGLSGLGDLVLTCSSPQSRNFAYGIALGESKCLNHHPLAEGVFTAKSASILAQTNMIDAPIIMAVTQLLERTISPREAMENLLSRPMRVENS